MLSNIVPDYLALRSVDLMFANNLLPFMRDLVSGFYFFRKSRLTVGGLSQNTPYVPSRHQSLHHPGQKDHFTVTQPDFLILFLGIIPESGNSAWAALLVFSAAIGQWICKLHPLLAQTRPTPTNTPSHKPRPPAPLHSPPRSLKTTV